jgi:LPXTG-motif cell wall-anchored protein
VNRADAAALRSRRIEASRLAELLRATVLVVDSSTSTTADPNRIIDHAISSGLSNNAPWLAVIGLALVLLLAALVWIGLRRRRRARLTS